MERIFRNGQYHFGAPLEAEGSYPLKYSLMSFRVHAEGGREIRPHNFADYGFLTSLREESEWAY